MFDETGHRDKDGGTWFFGRKDTVDAATGEPTGNSGYVALFSALRATWTDEPGNDPCRRQDREHPRPLRLR